MSRPSNMCQVKSCGKPARNKKLCKGHYHRLRKYGNTYPSIRLGHRGQPLKIAKLFQSTPKGKILCTVCEKYVSCSKFTGNKNRCVDCRRSNALELKYGITLKDYEDMRKTQKSRCKLCGTKNPGGMGNVFVVDHCHKTGKIRGLLCTQCNQGIIGKIESRGVDPMDIVRYLS